MEEFLDYTVKQSLSDSDILKYLEGQVAIVLYSNLSEYDSIEELLGEYGAAVILYEIQSESEGHWVFLNISKTIPNCIEYFDSYGVPPDKYLNTMEYYYDEADNMLSDLLKQSPKTVIYNTFKYQSKGGPDKRVSTCGRWVLLRYKLRFLTLDEMGELFYEPQYTISRDALVSAMMFFV